MSEFRQENYKQNKSHVTIYLQKPMEYVINNNITNEN